VSDPGEPARPPRIALLDADAARAAAAEAGVADLVVDLSVFRVWLQHPKLARWLNDLILGLLGGRLDGRLRELVIMRLGWSTASVYEWTQHWRIARDVFGVDPADVVSVRSWRTSDRFGQAERAVLAATDDVVATGVISADSWDACVEHVSDDPQVLLELVTAIGCWRMVSTILRSLEVPLEDGVDPWPPDGTGPDS
jgi:alkylhydroperoxidase family enzyme